MGREREKREVREFRRSRDISFLYSSTSSSLAGKIETETKENPKRVN